MNSLSSVLSLLHSVEHALLSTTSHGRLTKAAEPKDFDAIIKRMLREVKFYAEALLTIVLYIDNRQLESVALAGLLFTVIIYIILESLTGPSLHKHIENYPHIISILSILTKTPALSVFIILITLAFTQWERSFTTCVLCFFGSLGAVGAAGKAGLHVKVGNVLNKAWEVVGWVCKVRETVDKVEEQEKEDEKTIGEENV